MLEEELRAPVAGFFHRKGQVVYHEVPINGRIADLVACGKDLIGVELKLQDWRGGLRQAICYQLACTQVYLCLPFEKALRMMYKRYYFQREGVGVLGYLAERQEVRVIIRAQRSPRLLPFLAAGIRTALRRLGPPT